METRCIQLTENLIPFHQLISVADGFVERGRTLQTNERFTITERTAIEVTEKLRKQQNTKEEIQ